MEIQDLFAKGRGVSFEFDGEKGTLRYWPEKATRKNLKTWTDKITAAENDSNSDEQLDLVDMQLVELIASWDLTNGGVPMPVDLASVQSLPIPLKNIMRNAIYSDNGEEAKKGKRTSSMTG